jgi:hypothetical protein
MMGRITILLDALRLKFLEDLDDLKDLDLEDLDLKDLDLEDLEDLERGIFFLILI